MEKSETMIKSKCSYFKADYQKQRFHKKVLLRERKRHTGRRVVTTPSVVHTWVPPPLPRQGTPPCQGTPPPGYPPGRVLPPPAGYPPQLDLAGYPPDRVPPQLDLAGYPPQCLPHGILGNVAKHYGIWVPPPVDRQMEGQTRVKTLPSRRTTYAGGNKAQALLIVLSLILAHTYCHPSLNSSVLCTCFLCGFRVLLLLS